MAKESRLRQLMRNALDVLTACREILSLDVAPSHDMLDRLRLSVSELRQMSVEKDDPEREAFSVAAGVNYMIGATPFSSGHVAMWKVGEHLLNRIEQVGDRLSDQERLALGVEMAGLGAQLERERAQIKAADAKTACPSETDNDLPLTPSQLADRLGIPKDDAKKREALRVRLVAWRKTTDSGWTEDDNSTGRQPKFRYRLGSVWDKIKDMKP